MKLEDLQEYFNLFVIEYLPFKDKDIYQTLSNYLLDYYLPQSYSGIPSSFKAIFEDHIIPVEMYDSFLLSNGFPDYIVSNLLLNEKYTLIQSFMDFNRYKGTLESIRKVSDSFDDRFNIYELYINYIDTGIAYEWVFVPILIYQNPALVDSVTGTTFNFEEIISKATHFLISKETLESLRLSQNILLPIKTNLIMLDYKGFSQHSTLVPLYTSTILNHFKEYTIILYLKDGLYKTSLKTFYKLWYYIFFKLYNVNFIEFNNTFINFNFNKSPFPFTLLDLFDIKSSYTNINNKDGLVRFQSEYIDKFKTFLIANSYTSVDLIASYQLDIPSGLLTYIDNRLGDRESNNIVLSELYNSLITWMYSLQSIYDEYREFLQIFISQLPLINISLETTTSYILINHFKPYHVEVVLNDFYDNLFMYDKFDSIWMNNEHWLNILTSNISIDNISDKSLIDLVDSRYLNVKIDPTIYDLKLNIITSTIVKYINSIIYYLETHQVSSEIISDYEVLKPKLLQIYQFIISHKFNFDLHESNFISNARIIDTYHINITSKMVSVNNISTDHSTFNNI